MKQDIKIKQRVENTTRPAITAGSSTSALLWFIIKRHKFELVCFYALATTTAYCVLNFNTAWANFVR